MRRICAFLLAFCLCLAAVPVFAAQARLVSAPDVLRPGKAYGVRLETDEAAQVTLYLTDSTGMIAATVVQQYPVQAGESTITWDGMLPGDEPVPAGEYTLRVAVSDGETLSAPLRIGAPYPLLTQLLCMDATLTEGGSVTVEFLASQAGTLLVDLCADADGSETRIAQQPVQAGAGSFTWAGEGAADGEYALIFTLDGGNGIASMEHRVPVEVRREAPIEETAFSETAGDEAHTFLDATPEITPEPTPAPTPEPTPVPENAPYSENGQEGTFWSLKPGETDDAKIWEALTRPMVVYDGGLKASPKVHAYMMENPDGTGEKIAQLHAQSQGLNVIGEKNEYGYVLVEAFSNYDEDYNPKTDEEKAHAFELKRGYVKASALKTVEVNQEYGILIDKLTQRLYLFHNGERVTEMLVATGLIQDGKYYCETITGEYITISRTGGFYSGNMYCDMAIRINGGILLHEVPCKIRADGSHDYSSFEGYLGTKQSHGCIRIQRLKNNEGYNHSWLWKNLPLKTRVIIWDDANRSDSPETWYPNP